MVVVIYCFGEVNLKSHELFIFKILLIAIDWNF